MAYVDDVPNWRLKILYDGQCPVCSREMSWLRRRDRHGHLAFEDISPPELDPAQYGSTRDELMAGIHAVLPDGHIIRRMEVFRQAYRAVGLGWLLAPTGWPGLRWLFDRFYNWFARHRMKFGRCSSDRCGLSRNL